jgi:hypothetical protein
MAAITEFNKPIDYVIVQCGYVEKLIPHMNSIKDSTFNVMPLCLYSSDSIIKEWANMYDTGVAKYAKNSKSSVIALVNGNVGNAIDFTSHLMKYSHCGLFTWHALHELKIIREHDRTICVLSFDTESG